MKKIILWYNANRKTIWKVIGVIAVVIIVLQLIRYIWQQNQIVESPTTVQNIENTNRIENTGNVINLEDNKSVISGDKLTGSQIQGLEILDEFMNYCNNAKIAEAYGLLSEDCKAEMYPTLENFRNGYYNVIFAGQKKNISTENWISNTYKVKYMNDALASGIYDEGNTIQDYITLVADSNGNVKLNINNYIGKQEINNQKEAYGIIVKVLEKQTYMDYETYTFEIVNNSGVAVSMSNLNNTEGMYLLDINNLKYTAYTHELSEAALKLEKSETKKIEIKYYNKYRSNKEIKAVVFSDVILNYNAYINYQNPGYYKEYGTIEVNL